ncbi:condensation domain-containing protein [Streptomyces sp. enrichment culture]|uniref:condensation domain-containing protein n=1 Tax=Streptomyces sp. enrichment culture TaxID=1795815 RepID=UPI003F562FEE
MNAPTPLPTTGPPSASVEAKRERLRALLHGTPGDTAVALTPEQRGLLFLHRLDPGSGAYDIPLAVALRGPLDTDRLAGAFDGLMARHPVLATRVEDRPGGPVLTPAAPAPRLRLRDTVTGDAAPRDPLAPVREEAARPLDPDRAVLRAVLFRHAPDHHHLLLIAHHVVFDGDSCVIVLQDLWALYRARADGPRLPPAGAPFAVYAAGRAARSAERERALAGFWRARTEGVTGAPVLPFDRPGTTARTRVSADVPVRLGPAGTQAARAFAAERRTSVFAVLLAAYLLVLGRHDPARRLAVGTPAAIRHDPRFDRTVGCLINMIPVRAPFPVDAAGPEGPTAAEYVRAVRTELAECLDHADLPFPRIAELMDGLDPEDGSPFTCPFAFQRWRGDTVREVSPEVRAEIVEEVHQPGVGHVNLTLVEYDDEIRGHLKYDAERFDRTSAARFAAELTSVATALVTHSDAPVARVLRESPAGTTARTTAQDGDVPAAPAAPAASPTAPSPPPSPDLPADAAPEGTAPRPGDSAVSEQKALAAAREAWRELLETAPEEDVDDVDFFAAGGDSVIAVQLAARLRQAGFDLSVRRIYRHPTPASLARSLASDPTTAAPSPSPHDAPAAADSPAPAPTPMPEPAPAPVPAPGPVPGAAPPEAGPASAPGTVPDLSPVQSWFFEKVREHRAHWNQSVAVRLRRPVDPLLLRLALQAVLAAHPALTARVEPGGPSGHRVRPAGPLTGQGVRDLLAVADGAGAGEAERLWRDAQRGLDPAAGRTVRALLLRGGPDGDELRLTAHHLVVDAVSWGIVLADLDAALTALEEGELPRLAPEFTTEREWAARLALAAREADGAEYWRAVSRVRQECDGLLASAPPGPEAETRHEEFTLDHDATTRLLTEVPRRLEQPVHAVLTGAVALALARWRGCRIVTFDVETTGRPGREQVRGTDGPGPVELSRTVGWLTSVDPVVLSGPREADAETYLREAGAALAARPDCAGFLTYRHLSPDASLREELACLPAALVSVNHLGRADRLVVSSRMSLAPPPPLDRSGRARRLYPAEVYSVVREGRLRVGVAWTPAPSDGLDADSVRSLTARLRAVLDELAARPPSTAATAPVASPAPPHSPDTAPVDAGGTAAPATPARSPGASPPAAPAACAWPLTPQQYGAVVESLAAPDSGRHVEQFHWWWRGSFDRDRFARAWAVLFRRHAVLRARVSDGPTPLLSAAPDVGPDLSWSRSTEAPEEREPSWDDLVRAERDRGFAPDTAPLLRVVVREEPDGHRILLTLHHALLDGWSIALLLEELYEAYLDGTDPVSVDERRPDLRDHARWLSDRDTDAARAHWAALLGGPGAAEAAVLPGLPGPVRDPSPAPDGKSRVKPDGEPDAGGEPEPARAEVDAGTMDRLRVWAARHAATESNVLQALWAALLWRCAGGTGRVRTRLGVTLSGRAGGPDGVRRMPGMLSTTLPLDLDVGPGDSLGSLVERAREAALDLQDHEWAGTGQVHEWAGLPGGRPLFDSLLVVENYPAALHGVGERLAAAGADVGVPTAVGARTAYAVTALAHREESALVTEFVADPRRVAGPDAARLAALWEAALRRLAEDPEALTVADLVGGVGDAALPRIGPRAGSARRRAVSWPESAWATEAVRDAFRTVLGVADVGADADFYALGGHSLLSVRLLRALEEAGAPGLALADLLRHPTAGELARLLERRRTAGGEAPSVLVPLREPEDGDEPVTVYLLHPPGGQVACYGELAAHFPGTARLVGVQDPRTTLPGPPPHRTVEELARLYADALPPAAAGERLVLGGFSGGGVIAYEMARLLRSRGRTPGLVVLLDAAAPSGPRTDTTADGSFLEQVAAYDRRRRAAGGDRAVPPEAASAPAAAPQEYLDELARVADWMGNAGPDPFALLRETLGAVEDYRPGPYAGRLLVLRAAETDFGRGTSFDASGTYYARPALGWEDHCPDVTVREVPGNHVSLLSGSHAVALAALLADRCAGLPRPADARTDTLEDEVETP